MEGLGIIDAKGKPGLFLEPVLYSSPYTSPNNMVP